MVCTDKIKDHIVVMKKYYYLILYDGQKFSIELVRGDHLILEGRLTALGNKYSGPEKVENIYSDLRLTEDKYFFTTIQILHTAR